MRHYLTSFGISALFHAGVLLASMPLALWQDKLGKVDEPQPVTLSLAQFVPAPAPEPVAAPPALPESLPEPPRPEPKPVEKPQPKPEKKAAGKPRPKPKQAAKPQTVSRTEPQPPKPQPQTSVQSARSAPPAQAASNKTAEAAYKARLQNLIASRKRYPRMAEKAEAEGAVVVSFTVMPNGKISGARISKGSGNGWLDKAALQAVEATSGALPFPPEIRKPQWAFSLTVNFKLDW